MEERCPRCGGELREVAILANYKSFASILLQCRGCRATVERKENAHRPAERSPQPRATRSGDDGVGSKRPQPQAHPVGEGDHRPARGKPSRRSTPHSAHPARRGRRTPAKRLERPFNVRVTRLKDRPAGG